MCVCCVVGYTTRVPGAAGAGACVGTIHGADTGITCGGDDDGDVAAAAAAVAMAPGSSIGLLEEVTAAVAVFVKW